MTAGKARPASVRRKPTSALRTGTAIQITENGASGDMGDAADSLRDPKAHLPSRGRSRTRSRPALVHTLSTRHPPPGHRPGTTLRIKPESAYDLRKSGKSVWVREDALTAAVHQFFATRILGPDRRALLDADL